MKGLRELHLLGKIQRNHVLIRAEEMYHFRQHLNGGEIISHAYERYLHEHPELKERGVANPDLLAGSPMQREQEVLCGFAEAGFRLSDLGRDLVPNYEAERSPIFNYLEKQSTASNEAHREAPASGNNLTPEKKTDALPSPPPEQPVLRSRPLKTKSDADGFKPPTTLEIGARGAREQIEKPVRERSIGGGREILAPEEITALREAAEKLSQSPDLKEQEKAKKIAELLAIVDGKFGKEAQREASRGVLEKMAEHKGKILGIGTAVAMLTAAALAYYENRQDAAARNPLQHSQLKGK